jgi:hypothetical protein
MPDTRHPIRGTRDIWTGGALFLLSIGVTAHQLALMQILSYIQWYHFAYMIVALALLGFGASGTVFSLWRRQIMVRSRTLLPILMLASGLAMALAISSAYLPSLRFDLYLLFVDPEQILRLAAACLIYSLPFFLAGLAIALALATDIANTGFLYCSSLIGSGVGGLLGLWLISLVLPERLPPLIGLLPLAAGMLLLVRHRPIEAFMVTVPLLTGCLVLCIFARPLMPSQFKDVSLALNLPHAAIVAEQPSPHGLLQVITAPTLRQAPGLSVYFQGTIPSQPSILINGDTYGSLTSTGPQTMPLLEYSPELLGYLLSDAETILLLQPGGNGPPEQALYHAAKHITIVEPHPGIVRLLRQGVQDFTGYGSVPLVKLTQNDPRAFLAHSSEKYELIRLPMVGAFGGNIGLYALSEQYLLTRQSFDQAWQRLAEDGVLMASVWMDYPVKNPFKLLATMLETLEGEGIRDARHHIAAWRSWATVTFALVKRPLTAADSASVRRWAAKLGFDPLLLPDIRDSERKRFNQLQDVEFFADIDALFSEQRSAFYRNFDFNIRPATDNKPYFSQFLRFSQLDRLTEMVTLRQVPFFEMGSFILAVTLLLLTSMAAIFIGLPLCRLGWRGPGHLQTFVYFGGLGLGYMMLEIIIIQSLILFLGNPLTAAATVLATLLVSSGLGSLYSEKLQPRPAVIRRITGSIGLLIVGYGLVLGSSHLTASGSFTSRIFIAILAIAPIGFLLGMPFPLGLRRLHGDRPAHLPWAWGINGCFSVIGPVLATVTAVQFGLHTVYFLAAAAYLLALCSTRSRKPTADPPGQTVPSSVITQ